MIIYILNAVSSCLLMWCEGKIDNHNKFVKGFILFLIIFFPSLIAAFRGLTVGTDILTYVKPIQDIANNSNDYWDFINYNGFLENGDAFSRFEKGYVSLAYFCSRFNNSLSLNFFLSELIIMFCLVFGLIRLKRIRNTNIPLWLGLAVFYSFFYNLSFNMVRQSMAMFILFYAFTYLIDKKWIEYVIFVFIATLFHNTAIIGFLFLIIYWFIIEKHSNMHFSIGKNKIKNEGIRTLFIMILILIIFLFLPLLKDIVNVIGLTKYSGYIPNQIHFSRSQFLIKLPFLLILLVNWRSIENSNNRLRYFYLAIIIIDILLSQLSGIGTTSSEYGSRISWYTSVFYIYMVPDIIISDNKYKNIILVSLLILFLIIYWYIYIVILNYNATIPYIFAINK